MVCAATSVFALFLLIIVPARTVLAETGKVTVKNSSSAGFNSETFLISAIFTSAAFASLVSNWNRYELFAKLPTGAGPEKCGLIAFN